MSNHASRVGIGMKLNSRETDDLVVMRREGASFARLARLFNVSPSTARRTFEHFEGSVALSLGACLGCGKGWPTGSSIGKVLRRDHEAECSLAYKGAVK